MFPLVYLIPEKHESVVQGFILWAAARERGSEHRQGLIPAFYKDQVTQGRRKETLHFLPEEFLKDIIWIKSP